MEIPVVRVGRVFHIGTMSAPDRRAKATAARRSSLEGICLSVSLCPNAWEEIARLGGNRWHELSRDDALFLDVVAVLQDAEALETVLEWAKEEGLVNVRTLWKAWSYDDEQDRWRYMLTESIDDAIGELDPDGGRGPKKDIGDFDAPEGHQAVEAALVPVGTPKLGKLTGMTVRSDVDATDAAVMAWARSVLPELAGRTVDGVWWREDYDPPGLSAPRGGIFPERVKDWSVRHIPTESVDDEEELASMPAPETEALADAPSPV